MSTRISMSPQLLEQPASPAPSRTLRSLEQRVTDHQGHPRPHGPEHKRRHEQSTRLDLAGAWQPPTQPTPLVSSSIHTGTALAGVDSTVLQGALQHGADVVTVAAGHHRTPLLVASAPMPPAVQPTDGSPSPLADPATAPSAVPLVLPQAVPAASAAPPTVAPPTPRHQDATSAAEVAGLTPTWTAPLPAANPLPAPPAPPLSAPTPRSPLPTAALTGDAGGTQAPSVDAVQTTTTVQFASWGSGHEVTVAFGPQQVMLTPSSERVGHALKEAVQALDAQSGLPALQVLASEGDSDRSGQRQRQRQQQAEGEDA